MRDHGRPSGEGHEALELLLEADLTVGDGEGVDGAPRHRLDPPGQPLEALEDLPGEIGLVAAEELVAAVAGKRNSHPVSARHPRQDAERYGPRVRAGLA